MSTSKCIIDPNPDISGIGVRTAIYAQAVLTLVQPLLASLDGHISVDELEGLHRLYLGILLPGCALLFAAIIQARTFGLTVYHGLIVLHLSWINNTSALIFFEFALIAQLKLDKERDFRMRLADTLVMLYAMLEKSAHSEDQGTLASAMDRVRRTKSAVANIGDPASGRKFEGSKEILEDVARGLQLLEAYGNSLVGLLSRNQVTKQARDALDNIIKQDKVRLPKSLGWRDPAGSNNPGWTIAMVTATKKKLAPVVGWIPGSRKVISLLQRDWIMAALASAHLTLFAIFGLWLWFDIQEFGSNSECEPFIKLSLIFHTIPVASPALRIVSIVIYFVCLLPIINIVVFGGMELATIYFFHRLKGAFKFRESKESMSLRDSPYIMYHFILLTILVQAYFITSTELTIRSNGHLLKQNQEEDWTFGQTLAVALTVIPLIQVAKEVWKQASTFIR